jgi:SpoVK/Ycf46/Vps4 family AAA+-type ATPase
MDFSLEIDQNETFAARNSTAQADLVPLLCCLDQLLIRATMSAESLYGSQTASDPYRGLYVNHEEIQKLFTRLPGDANLNLRDDEEGEALWEERHQTLRSNARLSRLAERFELGTFDLDLILLSLATEVDLRYERLIAYLQDDVTRRRPTVDLALNLFCGSVDEKVNRRAHFAPDSPLIRNDLLHLLPDPSQIGPPLLSHYLKLDEQIATFLLGQNSLPSHLSSFCVNRQPEPGHQSLGLSRKVKDALISLALRAVNSNQPLRFYFSGPGNAEKLTAAEAVSNETNLPLLAVDLRRALTTETDIRQALKRVFRQAWLQNTIVYLDGCDGLTGENNAQAGLLANILFEHRGIVFLAGDRGCPLLQSEDDAQTLGLIDVSFSIPDYSLRRECWQARAVAADVALDEDQLDILAGRFRLSPSQVSQAVVDACNSSLWRAATEKFSGDSASTPTFADICRAARSQSQHQLGTLARKIEPVYHWHDIVLPAEILGQLRELCSRVAERRTVLEQWGFGRKLSLGKGVSALFAGPSGTGKTMAAEIIANELELELYKIDLSGVISKYIGETEKNLDRIFTTAESANAILFFDEADALFGKRSEVRDSHDRYANIEISYLLQKMEQYEGIAILATNLRQNLDEAFLRRLQIVVEFPFPDDAQRRQIWELLFPPETPRSEDIDFDLLARQFRIAGGNIKNIVLGSAFLAASDGGRVDMTHLWQSAQREYQKLGKVLAG